MRMVIDPRCGRKTKHDHAEILTYLVVGYLAGRDSIRRCLKWCENHIDFLRQHLEIKNGIASPATVSRVLGNIDEELLSFLLILIEKDRILFLREKLNEMEKIDLERKNTYRGIVKTTEPLSEEQYNNLITKLEKKYNKKIILQQVIDSSILGGIYVRVNNEVMNGTVKLRLEELKKLMVSAE